VNVRQKRYH